MTMLERIVLVLTLLAARSYSRGPCDPLVPEYCQLPLPNSFFTRPDASSPTGARLNVSVDTWPKDVFGRSVNPVHWNTMGEWDCTCTMGLGWLARCTGQQSEERLTGKSRRGWFTRMPRTIAHARAVEFRCSGAQLSVPLCTNSQHSCRLPAHPLVWESHFTPSRCF